MHSCVTGGSYSPSDALSGRNYGVRLYGSGLAFRCDAVGYQDGGTGVGCIGMVVGRVHYCPLLAINLLARIRLYNILCGNGIAGRDVLVRLLPPNGPGRDLGGLHDLSRSARLAQNEAVFGYFRRDLHEQRPRKP